MLNVKKQSKNGVEVICLSGSIEESANLETLLGEPKNQMQINCKDIKRINSTGVKSWIRYFQGAANRGTQLSFEECSTAIVEQINLIYNFTCGGEIKSVFVPYSCGNCKSELVELFSTERLNQMGMKPPDITCPKCKGQASFDDIPEEYFGFLMRTEDSVR